MSFLSIRLMAWLRLHTLKVQSLPITWLEKPTDAYKEDLPILSGCIGNIVLINDFSHVFYQPNALLIFPIDQTMIKGMYIRLPIGTTCMNIKKTIRLK